MLPPRLAKEIAELRSAHEVELVEGADVLDLIIADVPTGSLFNYPSTTVLLRIPRTYPDAGLDMFWTDPSLMLADGGTPQAAASMEEYAGRTWRRFSWHHTTWNAAQHNLHSYLEFVRRRFRER
jgi:hypothetical protein